ncbi:hypothetical protein CAPTEDRAFT_5896 [Capitella teleta]|uniref:Ribosomal RNA-processing protein 8 n=1 Tax=Capitella teleta TaxID=283909 RepID=R7U680_CAPTE|nr:hypothetical protein CAPTEDRAFT_5896 [Capitella teleta]|eukprot:ELU01616.1 hypothetical protein CAPTEDRAFT_5896 [Capitella teleta]
MKKRLSAGSFRYLNEQLYTIPGNEAFDLFVDDPQSFELYHHGYQSQVSKWPLNPVDLMIEYLRKKPADLNVADFGCGEAKIAQSVKNPVQSFDLVALNDHVTACDIADVPLLDESVDVGVFCLSLMGTNCSEYLAEANRVLVNGGKLLVAEVKSRFEKIGSFVRKMRKIGFNLLDTKKSKYLFVLQKDDNKMFVWLEFEKVSESPSKEALPNIDLLPCIYKKR